MCVQSVNAKVRILPKAIGFVVFSTGPRKPGTIAMALDIGRAIGLSTLGAMDAMFSLVIHC